jgi:pimeloyl-ACP methyl ester carboxylesterase
LSQQEEKLQDAEHLPVHIAPTLVLMHFLGGSGREWDEVRALLGGFCPSVTVDLPGFGDSADETGYTLEAMVDFVAGRVAAAGLGAEGGRYVLVGHSMSGTVACMLARRAEDRGDKSLAGLVLVAPSPPGPEPMDDAKRGSMIAMLGGAPAADDMVRARRYITKNESRDMPPEVVERAASEVLRMNRTAWVAWVEHGTREDHRDEIAILQTPALLIAGGKDGSLGEDVQRSQTLPFLGNARMALVKKSGHLIPMEQPEELAGLLRGFIAALPPAHVSVPPEYAQFLHGERVAPNTLAVLGNRMAGPQPSQGVLTAQQQRTLRAVLSRVVPQDPANAIDLAGYIMARLAAGKGDGWRFAVLPPDAQAYRDALDQLANDGFEKMDMEHQDKALTRLATKKESMEARWFEDLRSDAVEAWMGHPATMARVGFSGPGVGGARTPYRGFVQLGLDSPEPWEPEPVAVSGAEVQR